MSKGGLTKWDRLTVLGQALQQEAPGIRLTVQQSRTIVARCLGLVSRQSYYNQVEVLSDVMGVVEVEEGEGLHVLPGENASDDSPTLVPEPLP